MEQRFGKTIRKVLVFLVAAHVGERQYSDRLLSTPGSRNLIRRDPFITPIMRDGEVCDGDYEHADDDEIEFATGRWGYRLLRGYFVGSLETLRRQFESPGKQEDQWKAKDYQKGKCFKDPVRSIKRGQHRGRNFDQQPADYRVRNSRPGDISALDFSQERFHRSQAAGCIPQAAVTSSIINLPVSGTAPILLRGCA